MAPRARGSRAASAIDSESRQSPTSNMIVANGERSPDPECRRDAGLCRSDGGRRHEPGGAPTRALESVGLAPDRGARAAARRATAAAHHAAHEPHGSRRTLPRALPARRGRGGSRGALGERHAGRAARRDPSRGTDVVRTPACGAAAAGIPGAPSEGAHPSRPDRSHRRPGAREVRSLGARQRGAARRFADAAQALPAPTRDLRFARVSRAARNAAHARRSARAQLSRLRVAARQLDATRATGGFRPAATSASTTATRCGRSRCSVTASSTCRPSWSATTCSPGGWWTARAPRRSRRRCLGALPA